MGVPGEGAVDVNSKIFCTCDRLQNSPVKNVVSFNGFFRKVQLQVDKDQENAPSEKDSHSKKEMEKKKKKKKKKKLKIRYLYHENKL